MAKDTELFLKQVKLGSGESAQTYELVSKYIQGENGSAKSWADIKSLVEASFEIVILEAVPEASEDNFKAYRNNIILVADNDASAGTYIEYIILRSGSEGSYTYAVEKIGSTKTDLTGYMAIGTKYSNAALEAGAHTHTVSGSVTVPTVTVTDKYLGVTTSDFATGAKSTANAITALGTPTTANAITGFGDHTTANAITGFGDHTTESFVKSYPGETSKLVQTTVLPAVAVPEADRPTKTVFGTDTTASKATAGTAVAYGTADVGTAVSIPNVTGHTASNAIAIGTGNGATAFASFTQGSKASFTQGSKASFTQGSKAAWSAEVSEGGVLTFSFTANGDDTFIANGDDSFTANGDDEFSALKYVASDAEKITMGDAISVTPAKACDTSRTITPYSFTDVTVPVVSSNSAVEVAKTATDVVTVATGALASDGAGASVMTGLGTATTASGITALGTATTAAAITALGTPTTSAAITGFGDHTTAAAIVELNTSKAVTALDGDTKSSSDIAYAASVSVGSTTANLADGSAASAGAHKHDVQASAN